MLQLNKGELFAIVTSVEKVSLDLPCALSLAFPVVFLVLPFYKASLDAKATCVNKLYKMARLLFPMLMQNTSFKRSRTYNHYKLKKTKKQNMLYKRKNKITLSGIKYLLLSYNSFLSWFYISM